MKTTVVTPTYTERENIRELVPQIFSVLKKHHIGGNLVIVDDNSPDGTKFEVKRLQKYPITLIERREKMSLGSAYIDRFKKTLTYNTDLIFEMDANLSHDRLPAVPL